MLAAAYTYLCEIEPCSEWNLPPAEEVKFSIIRKTDRYAHYQLRGGKHHIAVSSRFVGRHETLLATMLHEMIHLHIEHNGISDTHEHGPVFQKLADKACRIHEFDRLIF